MPYVEEIHSGVQYVQIGGTVAVDIATATDNANDLGNETRCLWFLHALSFGAFGKHITMYPELFLLCSSEERLVTPRLGNALPT